MAGDRLKLSTGGDTLLLSSADHLLLTSTGGATVTGTAVFAATATFAATGTRTVLGTATFSATATFTATGVRTVLGTAAFSASAVFTATSTITPARGSIAIRLQRKRGSMAISHAVAKIASGQTTSNEIDLRNGRLLAIQTPTALTGTSVTFTARPGLTDNPGSTLNDAHQAVVNDQGTSVSVTVAASKYISTVGAVRDALDGVGYLKVVSGSSEAGDRYLVLVVENGRG